MPPAQVSARPADEQGMAQTRDVAWRPGRWLIVTPVTVVALLAALLLPHVGGDRLTAWVSDLAQLVSAGTAAVCAIWASRRAPGLRRPMTALAGGTGAWAVGQAIWCWFELIRAVDAPFPSMADVGFLLFPVGAAIALWLFPGQEGAGARSRWLLDGVIAAGSLTVISWATVLGTVARSPHTGRFGFAISLAYPLEDILVITLAISCLSRPTRQRWQIVVLSVALSAFAVSDSAYVYLTANGSYRTGGPTDLGWISAFLLLAALGVYTALCGGHGTPAAAPEPGGTRHRRSDPASGLPYVPLVGAVGALGVQRLTGRTVDTVELVAVLGTMAAVLLRQWITMQQNRQLLDEVKDSEVRLHKQAFSDQLTGLANRALFLNRVEHALQLHQRDLRPVSVLFCDLDDFKTVNDTLGHAAGDELLIRVSERLVGALRHGDTVARLGGDEFAVLVEDGADPALLGSRIVDALHAPFSLAARAIPVRASVGIAAVGPDQATPTIDDLMGRADVAMYAAKHSGKGQLACYVAGMSLPNASDMNLREPLARMLGGEGIDVAYQPIVELATGQLTGFEALARWTHADVVMSPAEFIPMAHRAGLLDALTDQVLELACRQLARWSTTLGHHRLHMNVNITPVMITHPGFSDRVARVVARHRTQPGQLVLEVTEDALLDDPEATAAGTARLHELGVLLALDDFGKGYSSLLHLQQLPLHSLKIDQAFIANVDRDAAAERLVAAILNLGRHLELTVIAEGIERSGQADVLRRLGCPLGQGYLFGRPGSAHEIGLELVDRSGRPSCRRTA